MKRGRRKIKIPLKLLKDTSLRDIEVARKVGCTSDTIGRRRRELDICTYFKPGRALGQIDIIISEHILRDTTLSYEAIAEDFKCSTETVYARRRVLGLRGFTSGMISRKEKHLKLLHLTQTEAAKVLGCSRQAVEQYRVWYKLIDISKRNNA